MQANQRNQDLSNLGRIGVHTEKWNRVIYEMTGVQQSAIAANSDDHVHVPYRLGHIIT